MYIHVQYKRNVIGLILIKTAIHEVDIYEKWGITSPLLRLIAAPSCIVQITEFSSFHFPAVSEPESNHPELHSAESPATNTKDSRLQTQPPR